MTVSTGQIIRVVNRYLYDGTDEQINVFHMAVVNAGTGLEADLLNDVEDFISEAYIELVPQLHTNMIHGGASVFNVSGGGPVGDIAAIPTLDGSGSSEALPPQNTALVVFTTSVSRVQGRMYLPAGQEANNLNGQVGATYRTAIADFADHFMINHIGPSGTTIRYRVVGSTGNHLPVSYKIIPYFRTQRSRTLGRGS